MTISVNTTPDLPYDYEDFGLDVEGLQEKYVSGQHPEYTLAMWKLAEETEDTPYNGYWDYVLAKIAKDDEAY
jgi:hypothetical protein